ncbi:hypothetical protein RhiirA4_404750 [Rhizophagus irregularis]|uniref:Uncharacterized protein n=1 Tax=Rhizophagus irregularis TaxID=588596 RepID=A0A2I1GQ60_9GLOM|nr:hypothetical protein RhiirA4_404750 [Rhizophagus irregularis]
MKILEFGKKKEKIPYQRYILSPILSEENESTSKSLTPKERRFLKLEEVIQKVEELMSIFKKCGEEMEWGAIKENLRIIVIQYRQKFTTLNNDFTKRVKEENSEIDEKNINEKRASIRKDGEWNEID